MNLSLRHYPAFASSLACEIAMAYARPVVAILDSVPFRALAISLYMAIFSLAAIAPTRDVTRDLAVDAAAIASGLLSIFWLIAAVATSWRRGAAATTWPYRLRHLMVVSACVLVAGGLADGSVIHMIAGALWLPLVAFDLRMVRSMRLRVARDGALSTAARVADEHLDGDPRAADALARRVRSLLDSRDDVCISVGRRIGFRTRRPAD